MLRAIAQTVVLAFLITACVGVIEAQEVTSAERAKRPWAWTLEERLAIRLNPALIAERQSRDAARYSIAGAEPPSAARETAASYSVDGARHPELLLPHELFDSLMTGFIPDIERRQRHRAHLRERIASLGLDEDLFWAQLASAASEYVGYIYGEASARPDPEQKCRVAFTALSAARQIFGSPRFDQILYHVVAPGTAVAYATGATDVSAELRRVARGCN